MIRMYTLAETAVLLKNSMNAAMRTPFFCCLAPNDKVLKGGSNIIFDWIRGGVRHFFPMFSDLPQCEHHFSAAWPLMTIEL